MQSERYYKGKYLIAVYDDEDYPYCVVSSVRELAEVTGKKPSVLRSSLSHKSNGIIVRGKKCKIHLIPIEEDEEMEEKVQVELTIDEVEIISHLIKNEIIVNDNAIVRLKPDKKESTKKAIEIINNQNGQLTRLQKKFKKLKGVR